MVLVEVQKFGTGTRYSLEILHQCGKRVNTKSQKVLGANSYICKSYRGKTGTRGAFCHFPPSWIGLIQSGTLSQYIDDLKPYVSG